VITIPSLQALTRVEGRDKGIWNTRKTQDVEDGESFGKEKANAQLFAKTIILFFHA
jgi:hypothetical protein